MAYGDLTTAYVGKKGRLFGLALATSFLTVITLGVYRFWMKTRLRRFYWSAIRPGGQPLEYVGEPLEKLLGFLIAVVFLAFYIGVVNLILMFLSFSLFQGNFMAYAVSFIGVVPVLFYARYRARRYILARTRWRGIRFGMAEGAWGYAWRAIGHWLITIGSLGVLWPRMTFLLEKYRTDRTYFGDTAFVQGGRWQDLYRPFSVVLIGGIMLAIAATVGWQGDVAVAIAVAGVGTAVALFGIVYFRVHSFRLMTNAKTLGEIGFVAHPRPWRVIRVYVLGYLLVGIFMGLFLLLAAGILGGLLVPFAGDDFSDLADVLPSGMFWLGTVLAMVAYFAIFIAYGVLAQVFVTLPLARHYSETLSLSGTVGLADIQQRERDEFTEAEGFADALDVGAAI